MRLPLRQLSDRALVRLHAEASAALGGFVQATQAHGSLIQSWVRGAAVQALEHYPDSNVVDRRRASQFFYHCHRPDGAEHGHVHLFRHATRSGRRRCLGRSVRGEPSHLIAIGLDARGLPVTLFTVNRWVTGGHWFDAETTLHLLRGFEMRDVPDHADACRWISGFVKMYEPVIARLLAMRDRRLARHVDVPGVLDNRRIEVLSSARLNWAEDLSRIEAELAKRCLAQG
jgi:hypothetical protein